MTKIKRKSYKRMYRKKNTRKNIRKNIRKNTRKKNTRKKNTRKKNTRKKYTRKKNSNKHVVANVHRKYKLKGGLGYIIDLTLPKLLNIYNYLLTQFYGLDKFKLIKILGSGSTKTALLVVRNCKPEIVTFSRFKDHGSEVTVTYADVLKMKGELSENSTFFRDLLQHNEYMYTIEIVKIPLKKKFTDEDSVSDEKIRISTLSEEAHGLFYLQWVPESEEINMRNTPFTYVLGENYGMYCLAESYVLNGYVLVDLEQLIFKNFNMDNTLYKFLQGHVDYIIKGVCKQLYTLHNSGYVHADIKAANVLYNTNSREVKLIDFDGTVKTNTRFVVEDKTEIFEFKTYRDGGHIFYILNRKFYEQWKGDIDYTYDYFTVGVLLLLLELFKLTVSVDVKKCFTSVYNTSLSYFNGVDNTFTSVTETRRNAKMIDQDRGTVQGLKDNERGFVKQQDDLDYTKLTSTRLTMIKQLLNGTKTQGSVVLEQLANIDESDKGCCHKVKYDEVEAIKGLHAVLVKSPIWIGTQQDYHCMNIKGEGNTLNNLNELCKNEDTVGGRFMHQGYTHEHCRRCGMVLCTECITGLSAEGRNTRKLTAYLDGEKGDNEHRWVERESYRECIVCNLCAYYYPL